MQLAHRVRETRRVMRAFGVRSPVQAARGAAYLARTVWDPTRTDVGHGVNQLVNRALREITPGEAARIAHRIPAIVDLFHEGYDPDISPSRLAAMPPGSLGNEYAKFIRRNGIDPLGTLLAMGPPTNPVQYMFRRAYKLHDVLHVALGCDASILGEVRIVAWSLGQGASGDGIVGRAPAMALAVLLMNVALRSPAQMAEAVRLAGEWLRYGEMAPHHVAIRFEDYLEQPVAVARAMVLPAGVPHESASGDEPTTVYH